MSPPSETGLRHLKFCRISRWCKRPLLFIPGGSHIDQARSRNINIVWIATPEYLRGDLPAEISLSGMTCIKCRDLLGGRRDPFPFSHSEGCPGAYKPLHYVLRHPPALLSSEANGEGDIYLKVGLDTLRIIVLVEASRLAIGEEMHTTVKCRWSLSLEGKETVMIIN